MLMGKKADDAVAGRKKSIAKRMLLQDEQVVVMKSVHGQNENECEEEEKLVRVFEDSINDEENVVESVKAQIFNYLGDKVKTTNFGADNHQHDHKVVRNGDNGNDLGVNAIVGGDDDNYELPSVPAYKRFSHLLDKSQEQHNNAQQKVELQSAPTPAPTPIILIPTPVSAPEPETKPIPTSNSPLLPRSLSPSHDLCISSTEEIIAASLPLVPAYQRFAHLVTTGKASLPLPNKFVMLEKTLNALDSLCVVTMGRGGQMAIFHKALKTIEASVGRRVELKHLQMIKGLLADGEDGAYKMKRVKIVMEGKKLQSISLELPRKATHEYLAKRREHLREKLFGLVMEEHEKFLERNESKLPMGAILKKWHPKFDLEGISDPPVVDLFDEQATKEKELEEAKSKTPAAILEAIESVKAKEGDKDAIESVPTPPLPKVKSSVLERIRKKQKEAELAKMTVDPVKESLKLRYERLLSFSETIFSYEPSL